MNLNKHTLILDTFTCPFYSYNNSILSYNTCISRQIAITVHRTPLYPECATCKDGQKITKHFKNQPVNNPVNKTSFATFTNKKRKRAKKGTSPYSCHYQGNASVVKPKDLKTIILAQVPYILKLVTEGKIKQAIDRIRLLNEGIRE